MLLPTGMRASHTPRWGYALALHSMFVFRARVDASRRPTRGEIIRHYRLTFPPTLLSLTYTPAAPLPLLAILPLCLFSAPVHAVSCASVGERMRPSMSLSETHTHSMRRLLL